MATWVAVVAGVLHFAPRWDDVTRDGDFAYLPANMTSVEAEQMLQDAFPEGLSKSEIILVVARKDGELKEPDYEVANWLVDYYTEKSQKPDSSILGVMSHQTDVVGEKLVSRVGPDGQALLIILQMRTEFMAVGNMELLAEIRDLLEKKRNDAKFPKGLALGLTGSAAIGAEMLTSGEESIRNTEKTTIILVLAILLIVYRAPGLVVVPMTTIFVSLAVAMGLVASIADFSAQYGWFDFKIFKTTKIFVVVILFGAGTDFCLFLISRYREELQRGLGRIDAIAHSLSKVGGAIAASAMTTVLGLGAMAFADFGKFRNSGPAIAMCLLVALLASVTLAPAMLLAFGRVVFWPFGVRQHAPAAGAAEDDGGGGRTSRFWEVLSRQIVAHPGLILVGILLASSPLMYYGWNVEVTHDLLSELQPDRPAVVGTNLLRRYFPAGETGPITIMAHRPLGGFDADNATRQNLLELSEALYTFEYEQSDGKKVRPITTVRSLASPLGARIGKRRLSMNEIALSRHFRTKMTYLAQTPEYAGRLTRIDLVTRYDPFSAESIRFVGALDEYLLQRYTVDEKSPWCGTRFLMAGTTAGIRDLKSVTGADLVRIQRLVPLAVLGVLVVILRRPLVSVYLVLSVLIGYFISIGTTELLFQWLYGDTFHGLDWKVPMYLFVILIAVGEDYNIYLATRVYEEQQRLGRLEGLRVALVRTGGIITSCGVIMAGTFTSMITGSLRAVVELGFALSFGVLLDTFVIRTILVPAFLVLWDRFMARWDRWRGKPETAGDSRPETQATTPQHTTRTRRSAAVR